MTAKLTLADDASNPPLNMTERSSAPSSPNSNDIYLDDGTNTASGNPGLRRYTGAAWEAIDAVGGAGMTSFDLAADSGSAETVEDSETATIAGGTGIDTSVAATNTVTVAIDSTVATLTGTQTFTNKTHTAPNETVEAMGNTTGANNLDYSQGALKTMALTGNVTLTPTNAPSAGGTMTLQITQDGTGGHTASWAASVTWAGGTAPTLSTGAGDIDVISLVTFDGGTTWRGSYGLDYS